MTAWPAAITHNIIDSLAGLIQLHFCTVPEAHYSAAGGYMAQPYL